MTKLLDDNNHVGKILVSGLINIETTLRVDTFPVTYEPVRYPFGGVNSSVSGVGYNIAKALTILGGEIAFLSLVGADLAGTMVAETLRQQTIPDMGVLAILPATVQSVILYTPDGKRMIHVDLKDIQERPFPVEPFTAALNNCDLAVLCNINYNRPFLAMARQMGKTIATDVHTITDLEDEYNRDYMAAADILFMSDEKLPCSPEEWAQRLQNRYGTPIIVIGLGREGALLAVKEDGYMGRETAVFTRPVINTIGAGDALFSAFIHTYHRTKDPYQALRRALIFASYKIGTVKGAAAGFLTEAALSAWEQKELKPV